MSPFPSAVQIGLFAPPARGDELSPITKPSMSKSKFAVRFRGFAFGERSRTHRSGSVYELIGWLVAAMNATCLPSGLRDNAPPPGPNCVFRSMVVILTGLAPAAATELRSVLGSSYYGSSIRLEVK